MNNQTSVKWTLNIREKVKGFALTLLGALIGLVWTGINPVILAWQDKGIFDITPFFTYVNWNTILFAAFVAGAPYFGYTFSSGKPKE